MMSLFIDFAFFSFFLLFSFHYRTEDGFLVFLVHLVRKKCAFETVLTVLNECGLGQTSLSLQEL